MLMGAAAPARVLCRVRASVMVRVMVPPATRAKGRAGDLGALHEGERGGSHLIVPPPRRWLLPPSGVSEDATRDALRVGAGQSEGSVAVMVMVPPAARAGGRAEDPGTIHEGERGSGDRNGPPPPRQWWRTAQ